MRLAITSLISTFQAWACEKIPLPKPSVLKTVKWYMFYIMYMYTTKDELKIQRSLKHE